MRNEMLKRLEELLGKNEYFMKYIEHQYNDYELLKLFEYHIKKEV